MAIIVDIKDKFLKLCVNKLYEKNLADDVHKRRLQDELKEIETQMEFEYFYDLYEKKEQFSDNENNLLVPFILGLVDEFNINAPSEYSMGEYPDIDVDYMDIVRDYLKNEWAPKTFGKDNVCSIGNYTTFGIKSSLIDMVRVHGKDRNEILSLTTKIGLKDEDGKTLTWQKALETYPELKEYCDRNPDIADAASRLINRNRGMGTHAGGLIISNSRIDNLVPLVRGKDGQNVSAFVEGLHGTDLGPLGLIKFDMLVITNLAQIAKCCYIIQNVIDKVQKSVGSICALPGQSNWTDLCYLNDPESLKLADQGKLKGVFQFDSQGIRELAKKGGVTAFEDLVAYNALFRPGPMGMGMHDVYVNRKRGKEKYTLHPILESILGNTYGVMCYQEQVMKILNVVGGIPDMHCEIVRKAISKKKVEIFSKYKEMFLANGQKLLGWTIEEVTEFWNQIESFAEYGFNKSHAVAYSYLSARLLYLKAHYPLQFFAAILSCVDSPAKIKEYKTEAEAMRVTLNRVDINKSGVKFEIVDDSIYMGFSNIKGVGEEVSEQIVQHQPYESLEDFLKKFGTDSRVVEPLISLNVFNDDPLKLYEYYLYFKSENKKICDRKSRFEKTCEKYYGLTGLELEKSKRILTKGLSYTKEQKEEFLSAVLEDGLFGEEAETVWNVVKKYKRSVDGFNKKEATGYLSPYAEFKSVGNLEKKIVDFLAEPKPIIENKHYGFSWQHLIEFSADYAGGYTFADLEQDETSAIGMVEVHVVEKPKTKQSKKGTEYFTVRVEDSNSRAETLIFWADDYVRFAADLNFWEGDSLKGNFLKMRVRKPDAGFSTWGFDAPPKAMRHLMLPKKREEDARMLVMARPALSKAKIEEIQEYVAPKSKLIIID